MNEQQIVMPCEVGHYTHMLFELIDERVVVVSHGWLMGERSIVVDPHAHVHIYHPTFVIEERGVRERVMIRDDYGWLSAYGCAMYARQVEQLNGGKGVAS